MFGSAGGCICIYIIVSVVKMPTSKFHTLTILKGGYISSITIVSDPDVSKPLSSGGVAAVFFFCLWTAVRVSLPPFLFELLIYCYSSTRHLGMEHHGDSTQRCLTRASDPSGKPVQLPTIGFGWSISRETISSN